MYESEYKPYLDLSTQISERKKTIASSLEIKAQGILQRGLLVKPSVWTIPQITAFADAVYEGGFIEAVYTSPDGEPDSVRVLCTGRDSVEFFFSGLSQYGEMLDRKRALLRNQGTIMIGHSGKIPLTALLAIDPDWLSSGSNHHLEFTGTDPAQFNMLADIFDRGIDLAVRDTFPSLSKAEMKHFPSGREIVIVAHWLKTMSPEMLRKRFPVSKRENIWMAATYQPNEVYPKVLNKIFGVAEEEGSQLPASSLEEYLTFRHEQIALLGSMPDDSPYITDWFQLELPDPFQSNYTPESIIECIPETYRSPSDGLVLEELLRQYRDSPLTGFTYREAERRLGWNKEYLRLWYAKLQQVIPGILPPNRDDPRLGIALLLEVYARYNIDKIEKISKDVGVGKTVIQKSIQIIRTMGLIREFHEYRKLKKDAIVEKRSQEPLGYAAVVNQMPFISLSMVDTASKGMQEIHVRKKRRTADEIRALKLLLRPLRYDGQQKREPHEIQEVLQKQDIFIELNGLKYILKLLDAERNAE